MSTSFMLVLHRHSTIFSPFDRPTVAGICFGLCCFHKIEATFSGVQYESTQVKNNTRIEITVKGLAHISVPTSKLGVLFMCSSECVIMNLGHWKEDNSKATRSVIPRLFTLPPLQPHLRPLLVNVPRVPELIGTANLSRSIMLTSGTWDEMAPVAVTKLCSTFRARRTSEKDPRHSLSPLMTSIS